MQPLALAPCFVCCYGLAASARVASSAIRWQREAFQSRRNSLATIALPPLDEAALIMVVDIRCFTNRLLVPKFEITFQCAPVLGSVSHRGPRPRRRGRFPEALVAVHTTSTIRSLVFFLLLHVVVLAATALVSVRRVFRLCLRSILRFEECEDVPLRHLPPSLPRPPCSPACLLPSRSLSLSLSRKLSLSVPLSVALSVALSVCLSKDSRHHGHGRTDTPPRTSQTDGHPLERKPRCVT